MWNKEAIKNHSEAARLVCKIKDEAFAYIGRNENCSEFDVSSFILDRFESADLKTDSPPMVAFRENTTLIHYLPKKKPAKRIKPGSLIMVDLWAGMRQRNAPFADVTWMGFYGRSVPKNILLAFKAVKGARDHALSFLMSNLKSKKLPSGMMVHKEVKDFLNKAGYEKHRSNYTGHSIGFASSHGAKGNLNRWSKGRLLLNQGYTLEPEVDYKSRFGIRLEFNFYINSKYELIITTDKQDEITRIGEKL